jgi:hypothetical protein
MPQPRSYCKKAAPLRFADNVRYMRKTEKEGHEKSRRQDREMLVKSVESSGTDLPQAVMRR